MRKHCSLSGLLKLSQHYESQRKLQSSLQRFQVSYAKDGVRASALSDIVKWGYKWRQHFQPEENIIHCAPEKYQTAQHSGVATTNGQIHDIE